jgi:multisubunit Na+/H+ antiporter MnhG subunit
MREAVIYSSLAAVVVISWIAALGAWRMREPTQALHYLALPATGGVAFLALAVFLETGWSAAAVKTLLIGAILIATNSIGAHATARAIRVRKLGHWEPRTEDSVELVPKEQQS